MVKFAGHLHVHDAYSLLDGNADRNQLSHQAVKTARRIWASPTMAG